MVASSWGWKRSKQTKSPDEIGEHTEHKQHQLHAIDGIFGEQLVWECKQCGITRRYASDIDTECPDAE